MIKKLFHTGEYPMSIDISLLLIRIIVGVFMLTHGIGKLAMLTGEGPIQFADPIGIGITASLVLTVFAEFFCSIFLIFGFATRLSAVPLLITMLVAAFVVHASSGFGKQELPLLYASTYILFVIAGAGKFSVDKWIYDRLSNYKNLTQNKMEILHKDDGMKGAFFVKQDNKTLAEMTYVWAGTDRITIDHTAVNAVLKGKGIGKQMVAKAVEFAREKSIKIIPLCPFARSVFEKEKDFNDVH